MLKLRDQVAREKNESLEKILLALLEKQGLTYVSGTKRAYLRKKRGYRGQD